MSLLLADKESDVERGVAEGHDELGIGVGRLVATAGVVAAGLAEDSGVGGIAFHGNHTGIVGIAVVPLLEDVADIGTGRNLGGHTLFILAAAHHGAPGIVVRFDGNGVLLSLVAATHHDDSGKKRQSDVSENVFHFVMLFGYLIN